jgi:hypothetical protein
MNSEKTMRNETDRQMLGREIAAIGQQDFYLIFF